MGSVGSVGSSSGQPALSAGPGTAGHRSTKSGTPSPSTSGGGTGTHVVVAAVHGCQLDPTKPSSTLHGVQIFVAEVPLAFIVQSSVAERT